MLQFTCFLKRFVITLKYLDAKVGKIMDSVNIPVFFNAIPSIKKNDHLNLIIVGWEKCYPKYTYSQYRDMYIIHYIKSGHGTIEANGKKYHLHAGDAYIVRPEQLLIQTADKEDPWELYYFGFNGKFADELINKTVFCNNTIFVTMEETSVAEEIADKAIQLNDSVPNVIYNTECLSRFLSFFDASKVTALSPPKEHEKNQQYIFFVKEYINANYFKPIKISDIASLLHINRSYLYRIFKESTNTSIQDYLVSIRITKARTLLDETDLSVNSISALIGYAHYPTFFKIFKRHTGLSPVEYRNKKSQNTN